MGERAERRKKAENQRQNEARNKLWSPHVTPRSYHHNEEVLFRDAVLEQYKIYVDMADKISARRSLTNTFFLTLNTLIFAFLGVLWKDPPPTGPPTPVLIAALVVTLAQSGAWWFIVRSYRQLNTGKYIVIGLLEERLPASPYWAAEWTILGRGKDPRTYLPLTHAEQWVPVVFATTYIGAFMWALMR
jgi:hypothetical protein